MTIEQLHATPMLTAATELKDNVLLPAQMRIEQAALEAEGIVASQIQGSYQLSAIADTFSSELYTPNGDLVDTRILEKKPAISPMLVEAALPLTRRSAETTLQARKNIGDILLNHDGRLIVITGPCSIHHGEAALEYAENVARWREIYSDDLEIIMRSYFEKPRTELDWKGLVYDPRLDGSYDINTGLILARMIAGRITDMGVPIAVERLNRTTPQYLNGLVAYDAIGARNTTDQGAREYVSGTSSPAAFKNTPDGGVSDAVSAVVSANAPHKFLGISMSGIGAEIATVGNDLAHIILRGGKSGPNYAPRFVNAAASALAARTLLEAMLVDASHANSGKIAANQIRAVRSIARQVAAGQMALKGMMLESNLVPGYQKLIPGLDLEYGKSITDDNVGLPETEQMLEILAKASARRKRTYQSAA